MLLRNQRLVLTVASVGLGIALVTFVAIECVALRRLPVSIVRWPVDAAVTPTEVQSEREIPTAAIDPSPMANSPRDQRDPIPPALQRVTASRLAPDEVRRCAAALAQLAARERIDWSQVWASTPPVQRPALATVLGELSSTGRESALEDLIGREVLPELLAGLDGSGRLRQRLDCIRALGWIPHPRSEEALLHTLLAAPEQLAARLAAEGLGRIGGATTLEGLLRALAERPSPNLQFRARAVLPHLARDLDDTRRQRAALTFLDDPSSRLTLWGALARAQLDARERAAAEQEIEALRDHATERADRLYALEVLGLLSGQERPEVLREAYAHVRNTDPFQALSAAVALQEAGHDPPEAAVSLARSLLFTEAPATCLRLAMRLLAQLDRPEHRLDLVAYARLERDPALRRTAVGWLARRLRDEAVAEALEEIARRDVDAEVREAARRGLALGPGR